MGVTDKRDVEPEIFGQVLRLHITDSTRAIRRRRRRWVVPSWLLAFCLSAVLLLLYYFSL